MPASVLPGLTSAMTVATSSLGFVSVLSLGLKSSLRTNHNCRKIHLANYQMVVSHLANYHLAMVNGKFTMAKW